MISLRLILKFIVYNFIYGKEARLISFIGFIHELDDEEFTEMADYMNSLKDLSEKKNKKCEQWSV